MSSRLKGRWREVERLLPRLQRWASDVEDLRAVAVVGSFARRAPRVGSDLDLILLSTRPRRYGSWLADAPPWGPARFLRRRDWGPVRELRLRRPSGLHLDVGVAPVSWAAIDPLDLGTARVLRDGFDLVHDPDGLIAAAGAAAAGRAVAHQGGDATTRPARLPARAICGSAGLGPARLLDRA